MTLGLFSEKGFSKPGKLRCISSPSSSDRYQAELPYRAKGVSRTQISRAPSTCQIDDREQNRPFTHPWRLTGKHQAPRWTPGPEVVSSAFGVADKARLTALETGVLIRRVLFMTFRDTHVVLDPSVP